MYMGDSINDMVSKKEYKYNNEYSEADALVYDRSQGNEVRTAAVSSAKYYDKWGTEFIVMPNSAYGDWQKATWKKSSSADQIQAMKDQLWRHSYLNNENFSTWYDGPSPITEKIQ